MQMRRLRTVRHKFGIRRGRRDCLSNLSQLAQRCPPPPLRSRSFLHVASALHRWLRGGRRVEFSRILAWHKEFACCSASRSGTVSNTAASQSRQHRHNCALPLQR
jgi:hypothetical protein